MSKMECVGVKLLSPIIFFDCINEKNFRGDILLDLLFAGISSPQSLFLYFSRCVSYAII